MEDCTEKKTLILFDGEHTPEILSTSIATLSSFNSVIGICLGRNERFKTPYYQ